VNQSHLQDCVRLASGPRIASVATLALLLAGAASARAQSDAEALAPPKNTLDAGLVLAFPAALVTECPQAWARRSCAPRPVGLAGLGRARLVVDGNRVLAGADLLRDKRGNPLAPVRPAPARSGAGLVRAARGFGRDAGL